MPDYLAEFLSLAALHLLAVISPGPDFAMTVRQSISYGRRTGLLTALGIGAGISVHIGYTVAGVGLVLQRSTILYTIAQLAGCAYLLWLAVQMLRAQPASDFATGALPQAVPSTRQALLTGFLTNATNPKATLFFLSLFTLVVSARTPVPIQLAYGLWMCLVTALWFVLVAWLFSNRRVRRRFLALGHWFERGMGLLVLLLAGRLLYGLILV